MLIDEIDKAVSNSRTTSCSNLDRMEFFVYETGETVRAQNRPIRGDHVQYEKELTDAFLARGVVSSITSNSPTTRRWDRSSMCIFPASKKRLVEGGPARLLRDPDVPGGGGLKKKPSTSELLDWLKAVLSDGHRPETLRRDQ